MSRHAQIRTPADFGFLLREERERSGTTQADLATRAGVSTRWLSNFERGKSPRAELIKVMHVARALGLVFELAEEQAPQITQSQQALIDAFNDGPGSPKVTPALADVMTKMNEQTRGPIDPEAEGDHGAA